MTNNWQKLLDQVRAGAPKQDFSIYIEELATDEALEDPVKLKLLGNAIADCDENRKLLCSTGFVPKLVRPDALSLQVVQNLCTNYLPGCELVLGREKSLVDAVVAEPEAGTALLETIALGTEIPAPLALGLIQKGYLKVVEIEPLLEKKDEIKQNFSTVYNRALTCEDEELGIKVIGNITSHDEFTLKYAKDVKVTPSVQSAVLLTNLSAANAMVPDVLSRWPTSVKSILELYRGEPRSRYTLEAAYFLRNVSRDAKAAVEIVENGGYDIVASLLADGHYTTLGIQLAGNLLRVAPNKQALDQLLGLGGVELSGVLLISLSKAAEGVSTTVAPSPETRTMAASLARKIEQLLLKEVPACPQTKNLWVAGSRALALLSQQTDVNISELKNMAPSHEAIAANFAACK